MRIKKLSFFVITLLLVGMAVLFKYGSPHENWVFFVENKIGSKSAKGNNLYFDDKYLYFSDQEEKIYALDKSTGIVAWVFDNHKNTPFRIVALDKLYLANFDSHIYSLNKGTGFPDWSFAIPNTTLPDTQVVTDVNDELLYFADRAGVLYALNKTSGTQVWTKPYFPLDARKKTASGAIHFGQIRQDDNYLYVSNSPQREFQILKKSDGAKVFSVKIDGAFDLFLDNGKIIFLRTASNQYIAIDKEDFRIMWRTTGKLPDGRVESYGIENSDNLIIDNKGEVYRIDTLNQKIIWKRNFKGSYRVHLTGSIKSEVVVELPGYPTSKIEILDSETGRTKRILDNIKEIENLYVLKDHLVVNLKSNKTIVYSNEGIIVNTFNTEGLAKRVIDFSDLTLVVAEGRTKKSVIYALGKPDYKNIWLYRSDYTLDSAEIYSNKDRLYFLDGSDGLIQSVKVGSSVPSSPVKLNFEIIEKFGIYKPGLEFKTISGIYQKTEAFLKQCYHKLTYAAQHIKAIYSVNSSVVQGTDGVLEMSIQHDQNLYKNYFTDIQIEAEFEDSSGNVYKVRGYYYDFGIWKLKFRPPGTGNWKWRLKMRTPYTVILKNGRIDYTGKVSERLKIIDHDFVIDGKVFFPIGLQDAIVDRNQDGNLFNQMGYAKNIAPTLLEQNYEYLPFDEYVELYKTESDANIYRLNIDNWGPSLLRDLNTSKFDINTNDAKTLDIMAQELEARDYKIMLSIFGFFPPFQDMEKVAKLSNRKAVESYLDYVIARYGSYVDIWEIANEASISLDWQNYISDYIRKNDVYGLPITTNWEQKFLNNSELLSIHWYSPQEVYLRNLEKQVGYLKDLHGDWKKAILISEWGLKGQSHTPTSADQLRVFTWLSVFNRMGVIYWNQPLGIHLQPDNANIYLGPKERMFIKNLQKFLPKMGVPIKNSSIYKDDIGVHIYTLENDEYLLGYVINQNQSVKRNLEFELDVKKAGLLVWYDPVSGRVTESVALNDGRQAVRIPLISSDAAFKITYN